MKKAIAMCCTKEQFEEIKPKLEKEGLETEEVSDSFQRHVYLINNYYGEDNNIGNNGVPNSDQHGREIHETWNEKVFLEACGISTIPTLEEVKEYFKDAETVKSEYDMIFEIGEIFKDYSDFSCKEKHNSNHSHTIWSKQKGYAEILTYKEKTYSLTKEQLRSITDPKVKKWFPEVFETVLKVGKWYKSAKSGYEKMCVFVESIQGKEFTGYGFDNVGKFLNSEPEWELQCPVLATESEVFEALKNEAVKRGFVEGVYFINASGEDRVVCKLKGTDFLRFYCGRNNLHEKRSEGIIFESGKWAEIIPTKTKAEAEKELNCKIID